MQDALVVIALCALFGIAVAYVYGCSHLKGTRA